MDIEVVDIPVSAGQPSTAQPTRSRAFRHCLLGAVGVLAVCAAIATVSLLSYSDTTARLAHLTGRAVGQITGSQGNLAEVTWHSPAGQVLRAEVAVPNTPPPTGTRTEIAYDPAQPATAIIPGASLLASADEGRSGVFFAGLVALGVLLASGWQLLSRARLRRRPAQLVSVRRTRLQRGLLSKSWLETEAAPSRWIPVYFEPALAELPAPVDLLLHGDPRRNRLVCAEIPATGQFLYPVGRVATRQPPGRRRDSPTRPDPEARTHTSAASRPLRQLRVDVPFLVPAPLVGLFWAYLDSGGVPSFLGATALCAVLGLWWAALRGSDPT